MNATGVARQDRRLGDLVQRAVAALRRREAPALGGDRPALHAVGRVHDQVHRPGLRRVLGNLVDAGRTHPLPRLGDLARYALLDPDVRRRVVARRVAGQEDARQLVERVLAVRLRIALVAVAYEQGRLSVAVLRPVAAGKTSLGDGYRVCDRASHDQALGERLLHVARLVEVLADVGVVHGLLVFGEVGAARLELPVDRLRRQAAGLDRVVDALQLGDVDHAARVAADDHARVRQARQRPVAALRDRLRAPRHALAALEDLAD